MSIKLKGSTAGSVALDAPANTSPSGSDIALTLPIDAGSANQYLANGSTAGELTFVTPPGSFTSYAIICDEKAADTNGGDFTASGWRTRDLNTEIADPDSIVSISSNQFTLGAGSYLIEAFATAKECNRHIARIYNATSSSVVAYGMSADASSGNSDTGIATVTARVTITGNTAFEIQHWCQSTRTSYGFGIANDASVVNKYTTVKIFKEA